MTKMCFGPNKCKASSHQIRNLIIIGRHLTIGLLLIGLLRTIGLLLIGLLLLCAVALVLCCAGCLCQLFCGVRRRTRELQNTTITQTEVLALFSNPRLPD